MRGTMWMQVQIRQVGLAVACGVLAVAADMAQAQAPTGRAPDAPFGLNRKGHPLKYPPGVEPGMPHPDYNPELPTLWLIGDSTVKNGRDNGREGGRWGWGHEIGHYFDTSRINIENQALGGTSSRSFTTAGWWESVREMIRPGDYLVVQFGHNDGGLNSGMRRVRARATLPGNGDDTQMGEAGDGSPQDIHTYGWYLRQYIRDARAKGATPIVCSLIPRNDWRDGHVIRGQDDTYVLWSRQAAEQEDAFWINLNHIICQTMDPLGEAFARSALFRPDDHTHTIALGAQLNAFCVVKGLKALGDALPLNPYLSPSAEPVEPAPADQVRAGAVTPAEAAAGGE